MKLNVLTAKLRVCLLVCAYVHVRNFVIIRFFGLCKRMCAHLFANCSCVRWFLFVCFYLLVLFCGCAWLCMLTCPVILDLAHDTRQRNAGGASGVMCRVLSLVAKPVIPGTTSIYPDMPRSAILTAFAELLELLEKWADLIWSEQQREMTVSGEPHEKHSVVCKLTRAGRKHA
jgi:hypothetical protein